MNVARRDRSNVRKRKEREVEDGARPTATHEEAPPTLPDDFLTRSRPRFESGSVLEALLADREESDR